MRRAVASTNKDNPVGNSITGNNIQIALLLAVIFFQSNIMTDVANVKTEVASVKTEVASVKTEVASVKTEVANVITEVASVKTQIVAMDSKVNDVNLRINAAGIAAASVIAIFAGAKNVIGVVEYLDKKSSDSK